MCALGALGVGQSESLSLVVRANVAGTLVNTVEVTSRTAESNGANNAASASTRVTSSNLVPTAHPQSVSLAEDTSRALTLTGSDPEGGALTFQIATNPAHGSLAGTGPSRTYTPAANYHGADSFTFTVRDPSGNTSAPAAVSITVSPVNDPPVPGAQAVSVTEDTPRAITLAATDVDGQSLTFTILTLPTRGVLSGSGANRTYTPNPNVNGSDSFTYRVSDGQVTANGSVSITIAAVNDPPVAIPQTLSLAEDTSRLITLSGSDVDGNPLVFSVVSGPAHGALTGAPPNLTYTPQPNFFGADNFVFRVSDGQAAAQATVSLTVTDVPELNTRPTISNILNQTVAMSRVLGPLAFTVGDVETAAGALALTRSSSNTTLVPLSGIAFGGSGANRTVTVTPAVGRVGTATITVTVSDGALAASDTFVLTVVGLPSPWASRDIGSPGLAGSAWAAGSVFTVKGSGSDIWDTSDSFHFAWRTMTGDGEIRARVIGVQNTNAWAKAGVMMRESLAANSRYATMVVTPGSGTGFQRRTSAGGETRHTAGPQVVAPYWVRVTRSGRSFRGYTSSDGVNWTRVGSVKMSLPTQVYFGLCVTSHDDAQLNSSSFDGVTAIP
jgi:Bacterial Ig domain/Domain of unknown function DUF11